MKSEPIIRITTPSSESRTQKPVPCPLPLSSFGIPNPLTDDASSLAFVQAKANEGSAYHTEALMITQL